MSIHKPSFVFIGLMAIILTGMCCLWQSKFDISHFSQIDRPPQIHPDYSGCVIPPNIAPLNFKIKEAGTHFYVKISAAAARSIEIFSDKPAIQIPQNAWHNLLASNPGEKLTFEIYTQNESGEWYRFESITNLIASEKIDNFLVYRRIPPLYTLWKQMGIYQRDLSTFEVTPIIHTRTLEGACINCHCFCQNHPDKMTLHIRLGPGTGMLFARDGDIVKIDTRTDFNSSHAAYAAWHPNGRLMAFSVNTVRQYFHAIGENRDVFDKASDLIVFDTETNQVTTCPQISSAERMETYPTWSPDGDYLYFCSTAQIPEAAFQNINEAPFEEIRYDLMRIQFNPETREWGELESVLTASETGLSIVHPRISPDGRFLVFCMSGYGNFTIYRPETDLYLMDLQNVRYRRLEINSDRTDSYHSWSSNSRWLVFSSKRDDGLCARFYFTYLDENGQASKPFVLPQESPDFYENSYFTYNVPELVQGPIQYRAQEFTKTAYDLAAIQKAHLDPAVKHRQEAAGESQEWEPAPVE